MSTTTYTITAAPKFAGMMTFDCADCGHQELGRPVFLAADGCGCIAVGTGCAARLTGLPLARIEAHLAVARLADIIADTVTARDIWAWFAICLPGRVTPKFIADTAARYGVRHADMIAEVADIYRAVRRADEDPRAVLRDMAAA